jgi:hypothetical protein
MSDTTNTLRWSTCSVDDQDAAAVTRACNVDIDKLRRNMVTYVESEWKTW